MQLADSPRLRATLLRLLPLLLGILVLGSCARPSARLGGVQAELGPAQQREAEAIYQRLLSARDRQQWSVVEKSAQELLAGYPGFAREDHVLLLAGTAQLELRQPRQARKLLKELVESHPQSNYAAQAWWELAALDEEEGRWSEAAEALVQYYGRSSEGDPRQPEARLRLKQLLDERLETDEIQDLAERHGDSVIGSYAHYLAARRLYEAEGDPQEVGARLTSFLRSYPRSRYAEEARTMLAELGRRGYRSPSDLNVALPDRIGLLCPLSGEYAALGQAMYEGALLALEEFNRANDDSLRLISIDTRGDEVVAVQAARRLIDDEGVLAIVGALLSPTTVAAATLCQERGVPLISPTATKETISELGSFIFQTNLTKALESRLLAYAAVSALWRRRFAILHPDTEDGRTVAELFAAEVERLGGRVVATESYDRSLTDFSDIVGRLRRRGPEALFVAASPSEMRLIAPQLIFGDLRAQLLGPSSWNNSLLTREVGESMDRAIFPSDIATIPEGERERFESLWRRRFRQQASNPFGLKSYFATRSVLEALGQSHGTRGQLRSVLELAFGYRDDAAAVAGLEKLRMISRKQIRPFPAELFRTQRAEGEPSIEEELPDEEDLPGEGDRGR